MSATPESFTALDYYSQISYAFIARGGERYVARYRLTAAVNRPDGGFIDRADLRLPLSYVPRREGDDRLPSYLRDEFAARVQRRDARYRLQIQLRPASDAVDADALDWREQLGQRARQQRLTQISSESGAVAVATSSGQGEWGRFLGDFASLLGNLKGDTAPLLLVLDTFEEVQHQSDVDVANLGHFQSTFQRYMPRLRTAFAGRAPIREVSAFRGGQLAPCPRIAIAWRSFGSAPR